jgi:hypothetical protein
MWTWGPQREPKVCMPRTAYEQLIAKCNRPTHVPIACPVHITPPLLPHFLEPFEQIGFLVQISPSNLYSDDYTSQWNVFARRRDRYITDFYITPINTAYQMRIPLNRDNVKQRLTDAYSFPKTIEITNPLLANRVFEFMENSRPELMRM